MTIIAIVRISGLIIKNIFDLVWVIFWHQAEGAVAIVTVSIVAFQSLRGVRALKNAGEKKDREILVLTSFKAAGQIFQEGNTRRI